MKFKKEFFVLMFSVTLLFAGSHAYAQTPDKETPAEETVCDGLEGDLFGLCNAYCEAKDCDSEFPSASPRACAVNLAKYIEHSGGDMPPCVKSPDPECEGATCATFTACNESSDCTSPVCVSTPSGGGVCVEGQTSCAGLADCGSEGECADNEICAIETCCGRPVCVPEVAFCPEDGSAGAVFSLDTDIPAGPTISTP